MTKLFLQLLLFTFLTFTFSNANSAIIYVDLDASGMGTGDSWTNARNTIQSAINTASPGDEIWIAEGEYIGSSIWLINFTGIQSLSLYGGFTGVETMLSQRDFQNHQVIMSGNAGDPMDETDNSESVIDIFASNNIVFDGFIIQDGYSTLGGGGIDIHNSISIVIKNCLFRNNTSLQKGGAIELRPDSEISISDCTFNNNTTSDKGGALYLSQSDENTIIRDCVFNNNSCGDSGGAVYSYGFLNQGNPITFKRCSFKDNHAPNSAGAVYCNISSNLSNCLFTGNSCDTELGVWYYSLAQGATTVSIHNCTVAGNTSPATDAQGLLISDNIFNGYNLEMANNIFWNPNLEYEFLFEHGNIFDIVNNITLSPIDYTSVTASLNTANNSTANPEFIDPMMGDFSISMYSPAAQKAENSYSSSNTDLLGNPRIVFTTMDIGCYEIQDCSMPNDLCADAFPMTMDSENIFGSIICANDDGDPVSSCGGNLGRTVWFSFEAPSSGSVEIIAYNLVAHDDVNFNLKMGIYEGTCGNLSEYSCINDFGPNENETLNSSGLTSGNTYYLRLEGAGTQKGTFNLSISESEAVVGCAGDFNEDNEVNTADLLILLSSFGCTSTCANDLNSDDLVNAADLLIFLSLFGSSC